MSSSSSSSSSTSSSISNCGILVVVANTLLYKETQHYRGVNEKGVHAYKSTRSIRRTNGSSKFHIYLSSRSEMNGVLGHLCAHIGKNGPGEPPEDSEMNEMTQTQDSEFEPWRSETMHATSRSRRFQTILNQYEWAGKKQFTYLSSARQEVFFGMELVWKGWLHHILMSVVITIQWHWALFPVWKLDLHHHMCW